MKFPPLPSIPTVLPAISKWHLWVAFMFILIVVGMIPRLYAHAELRQQSTNLSLPSVSIIKAEAGQATQTLILPGNVEGKQQTSIYAKTNGYVKGWYVDIGAHVKSGQLLAEIEVPELMDQLKQAQADVLQAEAAVKLAQKTADRYQALVESDSVAKQDADTKIADAHMKDAALASARANALRLLHIQAYTKIFSPFDGVITARNIDTGMLVNNGSASPRPLFEISRTDTIRVYSDVPEENAKQIQNGMPAYLTLNEYPGVSFDGIVVRNSNALNPTTRMLHIEVDVDNKKGEILSGAYVQVHLTMPSASHYLLPVSALIFRPEGVQVAIVDNAGVISLNKVMLGRDYGSKVEIVNGITGDDKIINNPGDAVREGALVRIANTTKASS